MKRVFRCVAYSVLGIVTCMSLLALIAGCGGAATASTTTTTTTGGSGSTWNGQGDGVWRRDAKYGEAVTFDPCNAHQPGNGEYHYHVDPVCLRYQVGDNMQKLGSTDLAPNYTEKTTGLVHSPILGYAYDGYPIYGPYGYSTATNSGSGVRRMVSSYALRTDNTTTRTSLPGWAAVAQGFSTAMATYTLTSAQYGPAVSSTYPLGRYIEDYEYTAGSGDLDQYNGRYCVTPEFPGGTYAYFVTIDAAGAPAFPYILGLQFEGSVGGATVTSIGETTTSYFANHAMMGSSNTKPQINGWFTAKSSQYATIQSATGVTSTTWTGNSSAVYADIQAVAYSATYVYVSMSGMASHMMGPWWLNAAHTQAFPNYPTNQSAIARIPLTAVAATSHTQTGGGAQGRWVNGVSVFNMEDFHSWSNSLQADQ
ncbi:MAG: YHYH protein [Acidobacteriaceae bacterium]|nr:YHYH protein [Acidobacteriaceae bacterium]